MPTGAGWLANALLELGVRATPYGGHWQREAEGERLEPLERRQLLNWHLPALARAPGLHFEAGSEVFFEHRLGLAHYPARPTILFVRDLRDAVFSHLIQQLYVRRLDWTPERLLLRIDQPEVWKQATPHLFELPAPDSLAYFYFFWLCWPRERLLIVRFEDTKRDPIGQLRRVLDFLHLSRSESQLAQAVAASDLKQFQALRDRMQQLTGRTLMINRRGVIGEWREALPTAFQSAFLQRFVGPAAAALMTLGYALDELPPPPPEPKLAPALLEGLRRLNWPALVSKLQTALAQADDQERPLLRTQLLALIWTQVVFAPAQLNTPLARRVAGAFCKLNAGFGLLPQLQRAAQTLLEPGHPLYRVDTPAIWRANPQRPLSEALDAARRTGHRLVLWQVPGLELQPEGLLQLAEMLDGRHSWPTAAMPSLVSPAEFSRSSLQRHAELGAEFEACELSELPPCLLMRLDADAGNWRVHRALGVLAAYQ